MYMPRKAYDEYQSHSLRLNMSIRISSICRLNEIILRSKKACFCFFYFLFWTPGMSEVSGNTNTAYFGHKDAAVSSTELSLWKSAVPKWLGQMLFNTVSFQRTKPFKFLIPIRLWLIWQEGLPEKAAWPCWCEQERAYDTPQHWKQC